MRISDWSSDVCSSDLGFGSTTQVGLTQVLGGSDVCLRTFNSANCTRYLLADLRSDHCRGCCSNPSHAWSGSTLCHWGCYCRILHRYFDHCFFAAWLAPRPRRPCSVCRCVDRAWSFCSLRSEEHTSELQSLMRIP